MNTNPRLAASTIHLVKSGHGYENVNRFKNDLSKNLRKQREEYEQEIDRLKKAHNEQTNKFCNEIDRCSSLLHQYKLELDSMRTEIHIKEKQESYVIQNLETKTSQLSNDNTKLKEELSILTNKYQTVSQEMQEARKYLLTMIASLS
ncbi:unnamed protein product [Rotaria magnacalcarata]|uniref:Uncharacterized protein n=1 Tax=Rotaria magnacalcarata TaxID=392030 RepID=A0A816NU81_9BILA|nr:unnamed protein product [Rotaria magnacalcarata]CAF1686034.1 unnamed protein product [Rotaria magnacalcarata]CAF2040209.1 unnamed protein product [Rotaria magnacalcarata]CAF3802788.1 unnamed protein product [Rotaria magnacalcarata]CAF3976068.1 unnamed protein product [Rotaria magnacalcarata]